MSANASSNNEETDTCLVCPARVQVQNSLKHIQALVDMRKSLSNKLGRIVLEEAVAMEWPEMKQVLSNLDVLLACLKRTMFWKIERLRRVGEILESDLLDREIGPCEFADFLENFLNRESTPEDLKFLVWVLESPSRCESVFKIIE